LPNTSLVCRFCQMSKIQIPIRNYGNGYIVYSYLIIQDNNPWMSTINIIISKTVTVRSPNTTRFEADRNFKDTWNGAIGARYRFAQPWLWSVGFAYGSSPVDDKDRTVEMPMDRQEPAYSTTGMRTSPWGWRLHLY
jgi:hypothetical protein